MHFNSQDRKAKCKCEISKHEISLLIFGSSNLKLSSQVFSVPIIHVCSSNSVGCFVLHGFRREVFHSKVFVFARLLCANYKQ